MQEGNKYHAPEVQAQGRDKDGFPIKEGGGGENMEITIKGVRGYLDAEGTAQLNLEDISRGLGLTREANSGNEVIRWGTVRKYLSEMGVPTRR